MCTIKMSYENWKIHDKTRKWSRWVRIIAYLLCFIEFIFIDKSKSYNAIYIYPLVFNLWGSESLIQESSAFSDLTDLSNSHQRKKIADTKKKWTYLVKTILEFTYHFKDFWKFYQNILWKRRRFNFSASLMKIDKFNMKLK